ncbi:MAG TPA: DUF302 domain-containing protein, partial [Hellea balneolensis]|nr:DUF302 domain-containing protein [Hellea balneolensis]
MRFLAILYIAVCLGGCDTFPTPASENRSMTMQTDGLITKASHYSVKETIDRLSNAAEAKGLRIFARVDHQANAAAMNLEMPASTLLIFGNPKIGSPLMKASPSVAIDLPVKALAYMGKDGQVYLSYNDPAYLKSRHDIE